MQKLDCEGSPRISITSAPVLIGRGLTCTGVVGERAAGDLVEVLALDAHAAQPQRLVEVAA